MIRYELTDKVAMISLSRPEKLNAFSRAAMRDMITALDRADADDNVRAIIVTGEGRAFCAGTDLSAGADTFRFRDRKTDIGDGTPIRPDGNIDYGHPLVRDGGGELTLRIFSCLKPIIAAVNGPAVGIGATMLLPMDIRLASVDASFGFVFARRGIVPESASSWFLPRLVGIQTALDWTMTGRKVQAEEARSSGLVRSVHAANELMSAAFAIAREIADNTAPVSVALTRQLMWRMLGAPHPMDAHRVESWALYTRGIGKDAPEGVASFLEKRPPRFPETIGNDMPSFFPWWEEPRF